MEEVGCPPQASQDREPSLIAASLTSFTVLRSSCLIVLTPSSEALAQAYRR